MTLVTLLGDDLNYLIPIIFEFKNKIKNHIIIYDDAPHESFKAKQLQAGLEKLKTKEQLSLKLHIIKMDEDSKTDMMRVFMQIKMIEKEGSDIYLNSTQGYAATALILSNLVLHEFGKVISYDLLDNTYNLIEGQNLKTIQIRHSMNLDEHLLMMNYTILAQQRKEDLLSSKSAVISLFTEYARFTKVKNALVKQDKDFDFSLYSTVLENLKTLNFIDENNQLVPSMKMYMQGNLLEEYVFWLCEPLGFDDIRLGVKIDFDQINDRSEQAEHIMNEFDILMMKNNRIFTIECKLSNNLEGLELVYKYDTIMDYFGAETKAILLNISNKKKKPYLNSKRSIIFNRSSLRRALTANMHVYHENHLDSIKFTNIVKTFFQ